MYHGIVNVPFWISMDYVIDDVIRSQNQSKFWIALTLLIYKLGHRSKAQNVRNTGGYFSSIVNFRYNFR